MPVRRHRCRMSLVIYINTIIFIPWFLKRSQCNIFFYVANIIHSLYHAGMKFIGM